MRHLSIPLALLFLVACSGEPAERSNRAVESTETSETAEGCCDVTVRATVPEGTGTLYLAGNRPELGPWDPSGFAMKGEGTVRTAVVRVPRGSTLEYKFTLGSWDNEAVTEAGMVPPNHSLVIQDDAVAEHTIPAFRDPMRWIEDPEGAGVLGQLVYWIDVESEFLGPTRHVEVWLPPGYDQDGTARYPVLYMSDGQNLFDPRVANTGVDWGVDEAIVALAEAGKIPPVIVVGAWSTDERGLEYSPWHGAPEYARFLIEELMPRVNEEFRTATGPDYTAVMGSSMGGLLSFYLVMNHPEVFGGCGCLSTHFPLSEEVWSRIAGGGAEAPDETPYIVRDIEAGLAAPEGVRLWFDYGTEGLDAQYGPTHAAVREWLLAQGLEEGEDFVIREYEGADHDEAGWRARLQDPLSFLFGQETRWNDPQVLED